MIAVFLLVGLLLADIVNATTYYVSTTGSDSNNGLTLDTPKRSVKTCAALLTAGDTCYVRGGTYTNEGTIRIGVTGTASAPIKLLAYPGERPIIDYSSQVSSNRIIIEPTTTQPPTALGYITVEGFEVRGGWEGIKFTNMHHSVIRGNTLHDGFASGIFGAGGHNNLFEKNIIYHQGNFAGCAAGTALCNQQHGMYMHGNSYTIRNNVIYDNIGSGIQQNGSSTSLYTTTRHPGPEFAGAKNWVMSDNTIAYQWYASAIIVWSSATDNTRIENNILYENKQSITSQGGQAVFFTGNGAPGILVRNNHGYATGAATNFYGTSGTPGASEGNGYTSSGNVVNVSAPAFVSAGATISGTPDFRLTASAPVNIARANEFLNNTTNVVGAFKTIADPTASISANKITLTFPMNTAVPIQVPSSTGISINCTGAACPGSPTVGSAGPKAGGTDSQVEIVVNGCTSNNCANGAQSWTISYNSATGSWTGYDNIGAATGLHQKVFSFTNIAVTNIDTGGPPAGVGTPIIAYDFNEGTGTSLTNTGSNGSADNGTLTNGPTWVSGKTGTAVLVASGTNQKIDVPHGNAIDPTTTTVMWALAVSVPAGSESGTLFVIGPSLGTNQRAYLCGHAGTWRISIQNTSCQSRPASNLNVDAGYNFLTVTFDSSTDVVTVTKNGAPGTGGATAPYTSFAFASDVTIGRLNENTGSGLTIDDFAWYTTVEDPAALYAAWNAPVASVGTFGMPNYQFQSPYTLTPGGSPIIFNTSISNPTGVNVPKSVVALGGVVLAVEQQCETGADCEQDANKLEVSRNGSGVWVQVPDSENDLYVYMWGPDSNALLNISAPAQRLSSGSCTLTPGATVLTASQVPVVDLPEGGCTVLKYFLRFGALASGYYEFRLSQQNGNAFLGTVVPARVDVIPMQAGIR